MDTLRDILDDKGRETHVTEPDATVLEAVDRMCCAHVGALLVMSAEKLVGIFSERDLMRRVVLARRDPALTRVGDVTTPEVLCVGPELSTHDAMDLMTTHRVRHLPVVDGRRVTGVVSIGDLVRWTIRDRERAIEQLQEYVTGRYPG